MKKLVQITLLALSLSTFASFPAMAASQCKGLSKTSCTTNKSCSWVDGYKRKDGVKVKSFCRAAPGKAKAEAAKAKAATKKSTAKEKSSTKKKVAKDKAKVKKKETTKTKSKTKEKKVKTKTKDKRQKLKFAFSKSKKQLHTGLFFYVTFLCNFLQVILIIL